MQNQKKKHNRKPLKLTFENGTEIELNKESIMEIQETKKEKMNFYATIKIYTTDISGKKHYLGLITVKELCELAGIKYTEAYEE